MLSTNTASSQQWQEGNRNLLIRAYVPSEQSQSFTEILTSHEARESTTTEFNEEEPIFGSNIRDAARIIRDWLASSYGSDR